MKFGNKERMTAEMVFNVFANDTDDNNMNFSFMMNRNG